MSQGVCRLDPVSIVCSGGLGAQILFASAYFRLEGIGRQPIADLSYFLKPPRTVQPGRITSRQVSIWPWELGVFGLEKSSFMQQFGEPSKETLKDGDPSKLDLALRGLMDAEIRTRFSVAPTLVRKILRRRGLWSRVKNHKRSFSAVHIRRGDYLNVAAWMVEYNSLVDAAEKHLSKSKKLVVLSDSPTPRAVELRFRAIFPSVVFLDSRKATTFESHVLMRESSGLVGSNSQFSLASSLLGPTRRFLPHRYLREISNPLADLLFQPF